MLWQAVPQSGSRGKEGVPVDIDLAEWYKELQMVASSVEGCWMEERRRDVNELMDYPVYHHQLCVDSPLL